MLFTTTHTLSGWEIKDYLGTVAAQTVLGTGVITDITSTFADAFGKRSGAYEKKMDSLESYVFGTISNKASAMGATAVIGLTVNYSEMGGAGRAMVMVSALGTAVVATRVGIEPKFRKAAGENKINLIPYKGEMVLGSLGYDAFLVKSYSIRKHSVLEAYVIGEEIFANLSDALGVAHSRYANQIAEQDGILQKFDFSRPLIQENSEKFDSSTEDEILRALAEIGVNVTRAGSDIWSLKKPNGMTVYAYSLESLRKMAASF